MDSIIRGTNAIIQIKIKEELDFATITSLELHIYQPTHQTRGHCRSMYWLATTTAQRRGWQKKKCATSQPAKTV